VRQLFESQLVDDSVRGELAEAESELRASLETVAFWGMPIQAQWSWPFPAELLVERGAVGEARALLDTVISPPPRSDLAIVVDRASMRVLLAEGLPEEALAYADVYELHAGWKRHPRYVPWRSLKAQALDRLGRQDDAVALAAEELEIARGWGSPGTVGRSLRVLGTILRTDGIDQPEEACARLEQAPARLEHAKALAALGATLRRARTPTEARAPLRRALELADVCGAQPLADAVRAEICATGARPRTTAFKGVLALTASERRLPISPPTGRRTAISLRPLRDAEDGRGSPQPRVPQAGDRIASRARWGAHRDNLRRPSRQLRE